MSMDLSARTSKTQLSQPALRGTRLKSHYVLTLNFLSLECLIIKVPNISNMTIVPAVNRCQPRLLAELP